MNGFWMSKKNVPIKSLYGQKQNIEAYKILFERLKKNKIDLSILKNKDVLNVGSVTPRYNYALKKMGAKKIDNVSENKLPKNWPKEFNYIKSKLDNLNTINKEYDFIFCNGILSHKKNWKKILKEIIKKLKIGGYLWLSLYSYGKHWKFADKIRKKLNKNDKNLFAEILKMRDWEPNKINFLLELFFTDCRIYFEKKNIKNFLLENNMTQIKLLKRGLKTDLNEKIYANPNLKSIYGQGEIRLIAKKKNIYTNNKLN